MGEVLLIMSETNKLTIAKLATLSLIVTGDANNPNVLTDDYHLYKNLPYRTWSNLSAFFAGIDVPFEEGSRNPETQRALGQLNSSGKIYWFIQQIASDENFECLNAKVLSDERHLIKKGGDFIFIPHSTSIGVHHDISSYENLDEFVKQAKEDLKNERYWDVVTKARTILETTFREICKQHSLTEDKDINKTFTNIRKHFKMDAKKDYPDWIKSLITSTAQLVNNIAEARNTSSSAHAPKYKVGKHHAQFCLEQAISLMNFIISSNQLLK